MNSPSQQESDSQCAFEPVSARLQVNSIHRTHNQAELTGAQQRLCVQ